ncbi:MAG: hydantoinase/oxoprolinase family protein [Chloroflexota bacterium]|nr:hydantoinase/oxoprolinase family protein [Chloroflexota bacterium]
MGEQGPALLGVDVGGTFTDFVLWRDGAVELHKRPSTPDDPSRAVLAGIDEMGVAPGLVVHGSTVATNTVIQRRGARTALVATEGMRDLLIIGRQTRPDIYDLEPVTPEPLVPAQRRLELSARLHPNGSVERPADEAEVRALVQAALEADAEALAVSLLYAYANAEHEQRFEALAAEAGLYVSLSSRVSPEYREVERTATTVLNAYVGPVMSAYLARLEAGLGERGAGTLRVVQSDGGSATPQRASALPVATLLSGPAAGVAGAFQIARQAGFDRVITFDMGGTSTDVALCDGALPARADIEVAGLPARTPAVDVHTVGAGGGSIARLDAGGALHVGPQSAGADPGPAAYGRGEDFTITDANLVLGRLPPAGLLGGAMALDTERSRRAASNVAGAFGGGIEQAAQAILDVAVANMERALRVVSVQRGFDPREFTLVAFGGAGPLHACALADAVDVPRVLVPMAPGVIAALGAAGSDLTATFARSVLLPLDTSSTSALRDALAAAGREAAAQLDRPGAEILWALDVRYLGQSYELTVDLDGIETDESFERAAADFHALHEARFAHRDDSAPLEVVNVRATARAATGATAPEPTFAGEATDAVSVEAWFGGERLRTQLVDRASLRPGDLLDGPALVAQLDSTTVIAPGWAATVDGQGNLLLERR